MKKVLKRSLSLLLAITIIMGSAYVGLSEVDFGSINITNPFAIKVNAASEVDLKFQSSGSGKGYFVSANSKSISGLLEIPAVYNGKPVVGISNIGFADCVNLTAVIIPDSVTNISDSAFENCTNLKSIIIPDSVTNIGEYAFKNTAYYNDASNWENNVLYIGNHLISADTSITGELTIKSGTITIANNAFEKCRNLNAVTIPNSVTSIPENAFLNCTNLVSVEIPDSVKSIGYSAFEYCINLESVTIPYGVTSIEERTFFECRSITTIKIPDSVKSIGFEAFAACRGLLSIDIPNSVTKIGDMAFSVCTSLTSVTTGNGVKSIGNSVFRNCTNLTLITIPSSVRSIGDYAFEHCTSLTSITIPDSVISIDSSAFKNCTSLANVTIGDSVTSIGGSAFYGCSSLTSITISDSVTSIGSGVFAMCENLTSISIPNSVKSIGSNAFESCNSLTSITIPNSVTSIPENAFYHCTSLTSIIIPNSVTSISPYAFYWCTNLTSITIPDTVTSIGSGAFLNCTSLSSIILPDSIRNIGSHTFKYCSSLTSVTIPDGVTNIDKEAFRYCTSLTSIIIPVSVTTIGDDGFSDCTSLKDVYYKGTEEQWKNISIGVHNGYLTNANIHYNSSGNDEIPDSPEYVPTVVNNGTFTCIDFTYSGENGFDYNDAYFDKPATEYNHELATMSLCLALSTFRDKNNGEKGEDNVVSVLETCKFENMEYKTLEEEPGTDSIGYAIAKKQVDENTTLIVCAVRSGGYEKEWASNVTLGETGDHYGFNDAANKVLGIEDDNGNIKKTGSGILGYIDNPDNEIKGKVKFWFTGYSRGAATATQAAAKLNSITIDNVSFSKNDVYAYGFATPAGAIFTSNPKSDDYANIHNIVHFNDLVPRVAPRLWGFGWYGNVYYLPFKEHNITYLPKALEMKKQFLSYGDSVGDYVGDIATSAIDGSFIGSPGTSADRLVNDLARSIVSRYFYATLHEDNVRSFWTKKMSSSIITVPLLVGAIIETLTMLNYRASYTLFESAISGACITHGTYGAYYLSWMQAMPDGSWLNNGDYRNILVNCPVDVYIYDSNGNLVAAIVNEETVNIENSPISYGVDENGQKVFYLPVDGEYDIKIEAREDCETTVTINEYTACSGTPEHVVTYTDIPMEADEVLESTVSEMVEVTVDDGTTETEAEYVVEKNDDVIEPTVDIADEEIENYTYNVNVEYDENKGIVYGGGEFTIGQFCQITAENKPGYKFSKWTVNGETVSTETTYRFAVTEDVTLVAEYVPCEHPKYKAEVVAPTCTVDGYTKHTCEVCNHSYNDNIVKSNGHSSSNWIIDEDKHTMHTECTVCKEVIETKNITVSATKLTSCYNEVKGVQLKWSAVSGAKSYKVYRKLPSQTEWVEIKSTTALEYQDTNVTGNTVYQYSVKAVDQYGNESDYSPQRECRFIETPTLLSRTNAVGGVTIKWKKVAGATSYRIYRRGAGVNYWYYLGDFPATLDTFTDLETANYFPDDAQKNALAKPKSGNYYRYTVRASYDGEDSTGKDYLIYSGFDTNGLYLKYVATPKLTSISNATNGLQIKWNAVVGGGPVEYRVYRRGAGSTYWYYLGTTTNTTWTDSGVKVANGGYYRYTVRAVAGTNGKGWYSAFDTTGLYLMRLANPTLTSAVSSTSGITVKWSAIKGTTGYYVYRKTANSTWTRVGTVGGTNNTTFLDKTAKKGTTYTYTVKAVYGATTSAYNAGISCYDKY